MPAFRREYKSKKTRKAVWCYQFQYEKVTHKESGFTTRKEALDAEQSRYAEIKGKRAIPQPREEQTIDEFMPVFIADRKKNKSPTTVVNETYRAKKICRVFGHKLLIEIEPADIMEHVDRRLSDGLSNRAINLELTFLRSFFKYAIKKRAAAYNPAQEVESLPEIRNEKWIPSLSQYMAFIAAAEKTSTAKFLVPWLWFRAFSGTRPRESFFVEWGDIDFDTNRIIIRPKAGNPLKNRKFRVIEIHPELKPILKAWREEWLRIKATWEERHHMPFPHDWVFMNPRRHDQRAKGYHKAFYEARDATELPLMNSYTLRHFFISHCVMSGVELFTIAKWVGHTNTRMIEEVYGHLSPDYRASQMKKLKITSDSDAA